ncbi:DUF3008 family protein [Maritalea sp.]|uniref:DUF3008 family protein n=1 Tax=Maritalea sp. TaxID=2003361 RepID=UPI003EF2F0BC
MKAQSIAQQKAAGAALSAIRNYDGPGLLQGASRQMYELMTEEELEEMSSTSRQGLPERASMAQL